MPRTVYDPTLPSNQQTLGTHVGVLSVLALGGIWAAARTFEARLVRG